MPRLISDAVHQATDWLTGTAGAPLRFAYDFVFPPLDDSSALTSFSESNGGMSSSGFNADDSLEHLDVWDSFSDSPWSFVASRYTIALVIVAIVNNRVQHICRPRGGASARLSQLQRVALRLPCLVLLARSVLILTTVVADAFLSESNPINVLLRAITTAAWRNAWLANTSMSGWASDRFGSSSRDAILRARDATALWAAFTSTCVAIISDSIVRNLDADRDEPPAFNLVGFAFLLHFHSFSPDAPANDHVYLCILLQMLQILSIAVSRCRRPVMAPRLVISSVFGLASLLHYALAASTGRYPFLEALSRTPEIALVLVVALTVTLHALTMLLLEGRVEANRLLFSRSNLPSMDEDWSLALFKLGTACMESTRLTGLEREMEPLVAWDAPYIELSQSGKIGVVDPTQTHHSAAGEEKAGGLSREIKHVRIEPTHGSSSTFGHAGLARIRALVHFAVVTMLVARSVTVMTVRKMFSVVGLPDPSVPQWVYRALRIVRLVWHGSNGEARRRERQAEEAQRQQQQRERWRVQQQQGRSAEQAEARVEGTSMRSLLGLTRFFGSDEGIEESDRWDSGAQGRDVIPVPQPARFNDAGANIAVAQQTVNDDSDEDDVDYDIDVAQQQVPYDSDDDGSDSDEVETLPLEPDEVSGLLEELTSPPSDSTSTQLTLHSGTEPFNRLLLAHLTRPSLQPLTRSAYKSLLHPADTHLAQSLIARRPTSTTTGTVDDARRLCVVCCTEERNVICWPCRCLCLCMDCREHLASRPPARRGAGGRGREDAAHLCPTCRTPVAAFSRLYIP
ncbi:hypothetical protein PSEUBRA_002251 [Kalmanozyma brasiliensis GHG001]|uniref:RING-type domain-containing protein n=1 Tax=Kalmanozyma brasiliensis (strain GHG001) TaxID=1365824 RepID=V5ECL1_KALBG|nr:uncharacterized protein PSEUBRA_002251 [Kalmanozyma brasiliensis GHG001]EST08166.1 hypothetical protein PSEUBRA_002251 [Kalmanozyma brasiliensis GHG001]